MLSQPTCDWPKENSQDGQACASSRMLSIVCLFVTPWTVAHQAPLSMGFFRQESWTSSGLPFPPPGDLPHPGTEHASSAFPALAGGFFIPESPGKLQVEHVLVLKIPTLNWHIFLLLTFHWARTVTWPRQTSNRQMCRTLLCAQEGWNV